jgi:hypothetical protein
MSEHSEVRSGQAGERDKDSDKDTASSRQDTPRATDGDRGADPSRAERQAEQDSALQRWETEGGADDGADDTAPPDTARTDTGQRAG